MSSDKNQNYKEYFEANKEKYQEKIICETCGGKYIRYNKSHHIKSKKHTTAELQEKVKMLEIEKEEKKDLVKNVNKLKKKINKIYDEVNLITK
jgi:hypothetical protein